MRGHGRAALSLCDTIWKDSAMQLTIKHHDAMTSLTMLSCVYTKTVAEIYSLLAFSFN